MTIAAPKPAKATTAERSPHRDRTVGSRGRGGRERHERGRVDQAEHEEREADVGRPAGAPTGTPDDGDADDVVEAARKGRAR